MHGVGRDLRSRGSIARPGVKIEFLADVSWKNVSACRRKSSNTEKSGAWEADKLNVPCL